MSSSSKQQRAVNNNRLKYRISRQKMANISVIPVVEPTGTWRCNLCNLELSSNRRIINHIKSFHHIQASDLSQLNFINYSASNINNTSSSQYNHSSINISNSESNNRSYNSYLDIPNQTTDSIIPEPYCPSHQNEDELFSDSDILDSASDDKDNSNNDDVPYNDDDFYETINNLPNNPYYNIFGANFQDDRCFPFPDAATAILQSLLLSEQSCITKKLMKKILLSIELFLQLYQLHIDEKPNEEFKLPTLNSLYNFKSKKFNPIRRFPTAIIPVNKDGKNFTAYMNLPSSYLTYLFGNPKHCYRLTAIPDKTPNRLVSLNQNYKWTNHELFKCRVYTYNKFDYWAGDIIGIGNIDNNIAILLESFYKWYDDIIATGYILYNANTPMPIFSECLANINILKLNKFKYLKLSPEKYRLYNSNILSSINKHHIYLLQDMFPGKVKKESSQIEMPEYYPLRIAPIIIFTDDMDGGSHKNISYETITIQFPGSRLGDVYNQNNIFFVAGVQNSKGLSAVDLIPQLVEDLKLLEKGIKVYSIEEKSFIYVISPLLWINADNPAHNSLCGLKGASSNYPCRKCFIDLFTSHLSNENDLKLKDICHYNSPSTPRGKSYYLKVNMCFNLPYRYYLSKYYESKGFKYSKGSSLLQLESFDPQYDTPIEILHTLCLGIIKEAIIYTFNICKVYCISIKKIEQEITRIKLTNKLIPTFSYKLESYSKYNGKDYKALIQILLLVFYNLIGNNSIPTLNNAKVLILLLAKLSSLIYIRNIICNLQLYYKYINICINEVIEILYKIEKTHLINPTDPKLFMHKLKTHLLVHLLNDI
jgi:hypothetical protein